MAKDKDFSDIVFIHEYKGVPNGLVISHLPIGPTIYIGLTNVVMRHDVQDSKDKVSLAYPHLVFNNFNERIGERIKTIIQNLFPAPINDHSKRIISLFAREDFISFRHHNYQKEAHDKVDLFEVGPRFEMRPFMIKLGILLDKNATIEWSLKQHMNTTGKNNQVSL